MVLSSRPRSDKSCEQGRHALVHFRQLPAHGLEVLLVRVPAFVVDRDVGDAAFDQPPAPSGTTARTCCGRSGPADRPSPATGRTLCPVAQDQLVGLLLGLGQCLERRVVFQARVRTCSACGASSRRSRCCCVGDALGDDAFDDERGSAPDRRRWRTVCSASGRKPASENRPCGSVSTM